MSAWGASLEDRKAKFKKLILQYHPESVPEAVDMSSNLPPEAQAIQQEVLQEMQGMSIFLKDGEIMSDASVSQPCRGREDHLEICSLPLAG